MNRKDLTKILKQWAQDHSIFDLIDFPGTDDFSLDMTFKNFKDYLERTKSQINILDLLNRLDKAYSKSNGANKTANVAKNKILSCNKCGNMAPYATPNTPNGNFICYSCRNP